MLVRVLAVLLLSAIILAGCMGDSKGSKPTTEDSPTGPTAGDASTQTTTSEPSGASNRSSQDPSLPPSPSAPEPALMLPPSVVVADVSPGANPYHVRHQRPGWTHHPSLRVPGIPADLPALDLTFTGDQAADLAADAKVWATYEPGQVYWVPETNLLLLTLDSYVPFIGGADGYNVQTGHGIATADAIGQACPECYVLAVQDWGNIDGSAMQHVADEVPWVDFVTSTSNGIGGIEQYATAAQDEGYARATRAMWERGGLAFSPTGNGMITPNAQALVVKPCGTGCVQPTYSLHFVNLPPWVVLVGGSESSCRGVPLDASKPTELVSDYHQSLATVGDANSTLIQGGTSYSTPKAAGIFAQALLVVRQTLAGHGGQGTLWSGKPGPAPYLDDGRLTNEELRTAMQQAATHFSPDEFTVGTCDVRTIPVSPTPTVEMGWGHLGAEEANRAAELILNGKTIERDPATVAWMESFHDARATVYPW